MPSAATAKALLRMNIDPDIAAEQSETGVVAVAASAAPPTQRVPLNVVRQAHAANAATRRLVEDVGLAKLEAFTTRFYAKAFEDPKLDAFIRDHGEPHAKRFAAWIFEKLGGGNVRPSAAPAPCVPSRPTAKISCLPTTAPPPTLPPGTVRSANPKFGAVWKSTSVSGAPDNSSLTHFSAMTWPGWFRRAVRNRHRHAIEQVS